jgi:hypothetical protein
VIGTVAARWVPGHCGRLATDLADGRRVYLDDY